MTDFLSGKIVACPICGEPMRRRLGLHEESCKLTSLYYCDVCNEVRNFEASRSHAETTVAGGDCLPTTAVAARSGDRRSA